MILLDAPFNPEVFVLDNVWRAFNYLFIFLVLYCNNLGFFGFESPFVCVILGLEICKYGIDFS